MGGQLRNRNYRISPSDLGVATLWFALIFCSTQLFAQSETPRRMHVKKRDFSRFFNHLQQPSAELLKLHPEGYKSHPDFGILPWDAPCTDCFELLDKREADSRYYAKKGTEGREFYIQQSAGRLNWLDDSDRWRALDPHLRPVENASGSTVFGAPSQPIPLQINVTEQKATLVLRDGFELQFNQNLKLSYDRSAPAAATDAGHMQWGDFRAGKDGVQFREAWPDTRVEMIAREGGLETDVILEKAPENAATGGWLTVEDSWILPAEYQLMPLADQGAWMAENTTINAVERLWAGALQLIKEGENAAMLKVDAPVVYDAAGAGIRAEYANNIVGYRLVKTDLGVQLSTMVSLDWLTAPERVYPVTIDPILVGLDSFTVSDMGFEYDAMCWDPLEYCSYTMDVTVPGKTTLVGATFDAIYFSSLFGCNPTVDCLMREAAFQILGPCGSSPDAGFWTCLPPEGDSSGTCYGDDLDMFNTIACLPPSCPDHVITFEMRNFMCSCNKPPCDIICHSMPVNSWQITIEGRTVEEDPVASYTHPDFEICEGDTIALVGSAQWGVPGYDYEWSPGGLTGDTVFVFPTVDETYTAIVFDECLNTDTVTQTVVVHPAPNPDVGPFEDCFQVVLDAGPGWSAYEWLPDGQTSQTLLVDVPGTYFVVVTDALGCEGQSQPIDAIINYPPVIDAFPDTVIIDEGSLGILGVSSPSDPVFYSWTPESTLTCTDCPDPLAYPQGAQWYFVTGELNGCESEPDSVLVLVNQIDLIIPNAFTPNGDGLNDVFRVFNPVVYPFYEMRVYNRWGQEVFLADDITRGWDGTFEGKNQELGTYIWIIVYHKGLIDVEELHLSGTVTLLR